MDVNCIKDLMTTDVACVAPDALLMDVIQSMINHRYSCMIVTENLYPVGIITERDIVRLLADFLTNKPLTQIRISEVMTVPVATITEKTTLFEALVISSAQKIRHLPVVDEQGRLKGLITQSDLAKASFQVFEKQRDIIENTIQSRTRELQIANEKLKELSMVDALMGIGNRRSMEVDLDHTHALALRYQRTYALVLFDVDYFKLYNDSYGHLAGDNVLKQISQYLFSCIRKSDRLYRYGGEEILMLLPETNLHGAMILAGRIVEGMAELCLPHQKSTFRVVTLSCGVACQNPITAHASWRELVSRADQALYVSKHDGRNRATAEPVVEPSQSVPSANPADFQDND